MKNKHSRLALHRAIITAWCLCTIVSATRAQDPDMPVTIEFRNISLPQAMVRLQQITPFKFVYDPVIIDPSWKIKNNFRNESFKQVLQELFRNRPVSYIIELGNVILRAKEESSVFLLSGQVKDEQGDPLFLVNIQNTGNQKFYYTKADGSFTVPGDASTAMLKFSYVGHDDTILLVSAQASATVVMKKAARGEDEIVKLAYGVTSRKLLTGSATKVSFKDIVVTPYGKVQDISIITPGMLAIPSSGAPGSAIPIEIRGSTSILPLTPTKNLNAPLIVINGVPQPQGNIPLNLISSLNGDPGNDGAGSNPLKFLNPGDIESIVVLKDADATAIYGARGAYGAMLITTKRGKGKKLQIDAGVQKSIFSRAFRLQELLNTEQYADLVKEAYHNSGGGAGVDTSELKKWGTERYTNFSRLLFGGRASKEAINLSLSGGNDRLSWLASGRLQQESYPLPVEVTDRQATLYLAMDYQSADKKLKIALSAYYGDEKTTSIAADPTPGIYLAPNAPPLRDSMGKLTRQDNGIAFTNPLALLANTYRSNANSLTGNITVSYSLFSHKLELKTSIGGSWQQLEELALSTIEAKGLQANPAGSFMVASHTRNNKIVEPQVTYHDHIGNVKVNLLAGGSWQEERTQRRSKTFGGYTNDDLLLAAATYRKPDTIPQKVLYRYAGSFLQLNGNLYDRYILNLTFREDASSRFAPGNRSGFFTSVGAGWLFFGEDFLKDLAWLSFGKLRASYGTTGSDRIGDYRYFDTWSTIPVDYPYGGIEGITQQRPNIPNYRWETTEKMEVGLDLEICKLVAVSAALFRHRTFNQLLTFSLPSQTGYSAIDQANFPATVQNTGMEFTVQKFTTASHKVHVGFTATYAFYRNKLLDSPAIGSNALSKQLFAGRSLSTRQYYTAAVDAATGVGKQIDLNGDGLITQADMVFRNTDIKGQAGLSATVSSGPWSLGLMAEARWQPVYSALYLASLGVYPGSTTSDMYNNQLIAVLDRWRKPGDQALFPRSSRAPSEEDKQGMKNIGTSADAIENGFYCALRVASLRYSLKKDWLTKYRLKEVNIYLQGENLFLLSPNVGNPSFRNQQALPAVRTLSAGIQIKL